MNLLRFGFFPEGKCLCEDSFTLFHSFRDRVLDIYFQCIYFAQYYLLLAMRSRTLSSPLTQTSPKRPVLLRLQQEHVTSALFMACCPPRRASPSSLPASPAPSPGQGAGSRGETSSAAAVQEAPCVGVGFPEREEAVCLRGRKHQGSCLRCSDSAAGHAVSSGTRVPSRVQQLHPELSAPKATAAAGALSLRRPPLLLPLPRLWALPWGRLPFLEQRTREP